MIQKLLWIFFFPLGSFGSFFGKFLRKFLQEFLRKILWAFFWKFIFQNFQNFIQECFKKFLKESLWELYRKVRFCNYCGNLSRNPTRNEVYRGNPPKNILGDLLEISSILTTIIGKFLWKVSTFRGHFFTNILEKINVPQKSGRNSYMHCRNNEI